MPVETSTSQLLCEIVSETILEHLTPLDLSGRIVFDSSRIVRSGAYFDTYKISCSLPSGSQAKVAAKRLRLYLKEDLKLLFEEIYAFSRLSHPNLLPLLGFAFDTQMGYPSLMTMWMENGSAWELVRRDPNCDVLSLIIGIAKGLAYLHNSGVVHSDVKSDNVLISSTGEPLLCDFGMARLISTSQGMANLSARPGVTARYRACELLVATSPDCYTTKSDVWAFGMTVFELMTVRRPYENLSEIKMSMAIVALDLPEFPDPADFRSELDEQMKNIVQSICKRCWIQDPEARISVSEIVTTLGWTPSSKGGDAIFERDTVSVTTCEADNLPAAITSTTSHR